MLKRSLTLAVVACSTMLLGQAADGMGCDSGALPTAQQIELNIPSELTNCPGLPVSPGATATKQQTAVYITQLYNVAVSCSRNNKAVGAMLKRYNAQAQKLIAKYNK